MAKINWFPGHMHKALGQIKAVIQQADFIVELRDARAPIASANPLLEKLIQGKNRLLVLNKSDLADRKQNERWQKYFSDHNCPVVSLSFAQTKGQRRQNAPKLLQVLQQNFGGPKKKGPQKAQWSRAARGLILGIPNVGKSTLINSLLGRQKLKVEDRAGITRQVSLIRLSENYCLFDSPGMLWPNLKDQNAAARLALLGALKDQVVEEEQLLCFGVQELESLYPGLLARHYMLANLTTWDTWHAALAAARQARQTPAEVAALLYPTLDLQLLYSLLDSLGRRLQCLKKAGEIDYRRLLSRLLRDLQQGKLGRLSLEHVLAF